MAGKNIWTEERQKKLVKLWNKGASAREIADRLGGGITRNAVIGKANRMGLSQQVKPQQAGEGFGGMVLPTSQQCQWPFGHPNDSDFHYCAEPVQPGWPYCSEHCALAYRAQTDREPDKVKP